MSTHIDEVLVRLGVPTTPAAIGVGGEWRRGLGPELAVRSPIDGAELARFPTAAVAQVPDVLAAAEVAFTSWRMVPAPRRGELVRRFGQRLREVQDRSCRTRHARSRQDPAKALGEVQEMIDICEFAVGLSRQLTGSPSPANGRGIG